MKPEKQTALIIVGSIVVAAAAVWVVSSIVIWQFARFEDDIDISVPLAEDSSSANALDGTEVVISIDGSGSVFIGNELITKQALKEKLTEVAKSTPDQAVILRGDAAADFQEVINVLDEIKAAGIWNVSFATTKS